MQKSLTNRNANRARIAHTSFVIDNGQLVIQDGACYRCLSGQETHQLMNLILDYRTDIVALSVVEQREQERRRKERQGHKKPKWVTIDGQAYEAVEVAELEQEQNE